jgi:outer membrane receptor for ferrienterochelin and colicins
VPTPHPVGRVECRGRHSTIGGLGLAVCLTVAALLVPVAARAQDSTGTLIVRVRRASDSTPLAGAFVRSGRLGGATDQSGVARIDLPATLQSITVSRGGYLPRTFEMTIVANAAQSVDFALAAEPSDGRGQPLEAARTGLPPGREPAVVGIAEGTRVTDEVQAHPADLAGLLNAIPGARVQPVFGPLDAATLRWRGVPGRYLGLLIDGLPLLGQSPGAYGLMEQAPVDLERVELVSGAGAALYGPDAPVGVINLVPRTPDHDAARLTVNQSSEKGGDVTLWAARRASPTLGATVTADFHQQRQVDADDDTWGEFPRTIRFALRPRIYLDRPSGDGLVGTVGVMSEDRTGGFLLSNTNTDLYREELRVRRIDGGLRAWRNAGYRARLRARVAAAYQYSSHRFDEVRERDGRTLLFGEVSYERPLAVGTVMVGAAYQRDALRQRDFPEFDYTYSVPALFGQLQFTATDQVTGTLNVRCDFHNVFGTFCTPRLALLARPDPRLDARLTLAAGYRAPTSLEDAVETLGLHALEFRAVNAERIQTANLDLRWRQGPFEVGAGASFARITRPLRLEPVAGDTAGRLRLQNAPEPTRIGTLQLSMTYRAPPFTAEGYYQFGRGTEVDPNDLGRRLVAFLPKQSLGMNLAWEEPTRGTRVTVQGTYSGEQAVWDTPRRTRTPDYSLLNLLVSQRTGRAQLYLSGENVFNVRLANYDPIFLTAPEAGGRITATPWVPLRGRVISLGALIDW